MPSMTSVWRRTGFSCIFFASSFMMSACSTVSAPVDVAQASPEWLETQKPQIAERAEARWKALIKGDFDAAYLYATPEYRSVFSVQQFRGRFGSAVAWKLARVASVEYDRSNVAQVVVEVEYSASAGMHEVRGVRQMKESWVYTAGSGWYKSE